MKKKMVAILLGAALALTAVGCGNKNSDTQEGTEVASAESVTTTEAASAAEEIAYVPFPEVADCDVTLPAYDPMTIELSGEYAITDDNVHKIINTLMENMNITEEHDTVAEGDYTNVDYTGYKDGVAFDGGSATNQLLDVSNNCAAGGGTSFIDGFTAGLIGQKVGETVSYEVTFPEDYGNEDLKGQTVVFEFKINSSYKQLTVDDLTDELVEAKMSEQLTVKTVSQLTQYVTTYIASQNAYNYILDYVLSNGSCEAPKEYVDYMTKRYVNYMGQTNFGSYEAMVSAYEANGGKWQEYEDASLRPSVEQEVKTEILFVAIAEDAGLEITDEQIKEAAESYLAANGGEFETEEELYTAMGYGDAQAGKDYLRVSYINGRAINYITEHAKAVDENGNEIKLTFDLDDVE